MLTNTVGPQMVGATDLKSTLGKALDKGFKGSSSDSSFGQALQDKLSLSSPKDTKESPPKEARAQDQKENSDPPTKSEERAEQKVAKPDGTLKKKSANRQQAIKEFMDSFESEFEIPPTRLVEAMAQLDDSQLKESPESTADAVIKQLGLDDAQAEKARAMYASMLLQLQQNPQQPQKPVAEMSAGFGMSSQQGMQLRTAAAQERQNMMGSAIENLNKKFWMNKEPAAANTAMPDLNGNLAQRMMMDDAMGDPRAASLQEMSSEASGAQSSSMKLEELAPHLQGQMTDAISPSLLAALAAKKAQDMSQMSSDEGSGTTPELSEEFSQVLEGPRTESGQQQSHIHGAIEGKAGAQEFFQQQQNESQGQSLMQNSKEFMQQSTGQSKDAAKEKLVTKSADFKTALTGMEGLQAQPLKADALKLQPMMGMAPAAVPGQKSTENEAAVKQLMNQAQYLIKNGGGEVKVEMTPEGMGTIHLKVLLQDGKVNLQMSADTQEAKKTIESSLAELKTSLAAHKLSVENVKVDVVNSTSTDTATQNQTNMNGQGQHKEARQFWNQFNDNFGNQGRREALADFQNIKSYGGKGRDPLQPIEGANVKSAARSVSGKGSGLNLVA